MSNPSSLRRNPAVARSVLVACSGNVVEWFDFFAYAFAAIHFAAVFFPTGDATSQLLKTAGIFAAGFLMRPIGAWFFGRLADRRGRRASMVASVSLMGVGSLLIAVLPTPDQVGLWAPALLLFARLLQGLSVGGEYGASATFLSEATLPGRRGYYGSFQYATMIGGQLLASMVLTLLEHQLTTGEMRQWGWRVPFFIGAAGSLVALWVRREMPETVSAEVGRERLSGTLRGLLQHPRAVVLVFGLTAGTSLLFYTFTTYMQKYLVNTAGLSALVSSRVMTAALFVFMVLQPLFGVLADRFGRRRQMIVFSLFFVLGTTPLLQALGRVSDGWTAFLLVITALTGMSLYTAISGVLKAELFPAGVRAIGVSFPYAIANALFGGTAEYFALWLKSQGHEGWFSWYVTAVCLGVLACSLALPRHESASHLDRT
jgi:MHS family alpha-ketoglutarate permease-like MFS transporter